MKSRKISFDLVFIIIISFSVLLIMPTTSNASQIDENIKHISIEKSKDNFQPIENIVKEPADQITPNFVNPYRYTKENVSKRTAWSAWKRVSDDLETQGAGGSLVADRTATFSSSSSGNIKGLNISIGGSLTSKKGYILHVEPYKKQYMAYRVRMEIETGTNVRTDVVTGKKVRTSYTVRRVLNGAYGLLNARK